MSRGSFIHRLIVMAQRKGLGIEEALKGIKLRQKAPKGHDWRGRRHKLKRSRQNHQRNVSPSRRH